MKITIFRTSTTFLRWLTKQRACRTYHHQRETESILKSKLTQFVAMAQLMNTTYVKELEIVASEPEDANRLLDYMMKGKI